MIRRLISVFAIAIVAATSGVASTEDVGALSRAIGLAGKGDWDGAARQARQAGAVSEDILNWRRLRAGAGEFGEYVDFLSRRGDWPGLPLLQRRGELALRGHEAPEVVVDYFAELPPQSGAGSLGLIMAHRALGNSAAAETEAVRAWRTAPMDAAVEDRLLQLYGPSLAPHHGGRINNMIWSGQIAAARRMLPRVTPGTRAVAEARIALREDLPGVDRLIEAVPDYMLGSAGLAYDRFAWRIRKDRYDDAAALLLERSTDIEALGDPAEWANWRRILARREMREGDPKRAYLMAARHFLTEGADYADLEWLAGYIALRKLNEPGAALDHFRRFHAAVSSPISLGRAGYWEGRALEALGRPDEAQAAYVAGGAHQTSFYGLLAAERAGMPADPALAGTETYPDWRGAAFTGSSVFKAAMLQYAAGDRASAKRFLLHLGEGLSVDGLGQLAGLALELEDPHLALMIAKAAAGRGAVFPRAYYPLNGLEKMDLSVPAELALSIARRESEFDPSVVSGVGAQGLMQVMPATGRAMAERLGISFDGARMVRDWQYNARLGAAYLEELQSEFGTAPALVAASYNAGPSRSRRWIAAHGDPRAAEVDAVDWIEHIQFRETQNYVMRVLESLPVYRARLKGSAGPLRLSEELKGK